MSEMTRCPNCGEMSYCVEECTDLGMPVGIRCEHCAGGEGADMAGRLSGESYADASRPQAFYIDEDADGWMLVQGDAATDTALCTSLGNKNTGLIVASGLTKEAAENLLSDANAGRII